MEVQESNIPEILILKPDKYSDQRGFFSETYNQLKLSQLGISTAFVQDNFSLSAREGTVRGLHFQTPPYAQAKLVSVISGAIVDIAVDIRTGSPTFGQHVAVEISARAWNQILIPVGFAHGFCTLEPDTRVCYKVSHYYSPDHDRGILWNDPELGIDWPMKVETAILSEKDRHWPRLRELPEVFHYE